MKHCGHIVTTPKGAKGTTRNSEPLVNGKVVVFLEDDKGDPIIDDRGQQKKVLVDRSKLIVRGFVD